jgi:SHS2 domain-containing protein
MKKLYEVIEHTADIGIIAYGNDLSNCFTNAAHGMFDLITNSSSIDEKGEYQIELSANDLEQLLVDFLSELLFLHSSRNLIFGLFNVILNLKKCSLSAIVKGEKFNLSKHRYGMEIKAVTYHLIEVHQTPPFFVKILFDI